MTLQVVHTTSSKSNLIHQINSGSFRLTAFSLPIHAQVIFIVLYGVGISAGTGYQ